MGKGSGGWEGGGGGEMRRECGAEGQLSPE